MLRRETIAEAYFNRRMGALLGLGFAAGLPSVYFLLGSTLQAWLLDYGYGVKEVGLTALLGLPAAFNFAWAPLLDRYAPPLLGRLGRRRGWLLLWQLAIIAGIAALAMCDPGRPVALMAIAFMVAFFVASHDVVGDAYRTDVLPDAELGAGAAVYVNGYRIGMLVAGGGALALADHMSWRSVYLLLAGMMLFGVMATLLAPEPAQQARPASLGEAFVKPVSAFFARTGWMGPVMLVFIVLFKLPDAMARAMRNPLLLDALGYTKTQVATGEAISLVALMVGAVTGGAMVVRLGLVGSLWIAIVLQAVSNLGFCVLAMLHEPGAAPLLVVVTIESFCGGVATAGFIAFLMSQCDRRYSATQYALFASLNFFVGMVSGAMTGFVVESVGYVTFFAMTVAAGLPAALLLLLIARRIVGRADSV